MIELSERIRLKMAEHGLKAVDLVRKAGVSKGAVSQWLNGVAEPSSKNAIALSKALRCDPTWLMSGKGDPSSNDFVAYDFIDIPLLDVELSAGAGTHSELENVMDWIPISSEWITKNNFSSDNLKAVAVRGDSMSPRLQDGDVLLINAAEIKPQSGYVYAIAVDDELRVKRLVKRMDGSWIISSDNKANPAYVDETISHHNFEQLRIIGRAVKVLMGDL